MYRKGIWLLLVVLVLESCYKESITKTGTFTPDAPTITVEGKVLSRLVDENGQGLADYSMQTNEQNLLTDAEGVIQWDREFISLYLEGYTLRSSGVFPYVYQTPSLTPQGVQTAVFQAFRESTEGERVEINQSHELEISADIGLFIPNKAVMAQSGTTYDVRFKMLTGDEREEFVHNHPTYAYGEGEYSFIHAKEIIFWSLRGQDGSLLELDEPLELIVRGSAWDQVEFFQQTEGGSYQRLELESRNNEESVFFLDRVAPIVIGREEKTELVSGKILDSSGSPLTGGDLKFQREEDGLLFNFNLSNQGEYQLRLPEGRYSARVENVCEPTLMTDVLDLQDLNGSIMLEGEVSWLKLDATVAGCQGEPFEGYLLARQADDTQLIPVQNGRVEQWMPGCADEDWRVRIRSYRENTSVNQLTLNAANGDFNKPIIACSNPPRIGARLIIGSDTIRFEDVQASFNVDGGVINSAVFDVSADLQQETHVYMLDESQTPPEWTSPSSFNNGGYAIFKIHEPPVINEFQVDGDDFIQFELNDIEFMDLNSNFFPRGSVIYIAPK